ncbi:MAG: ParB/RepB/Spo0J family partition protein [Bdellovibrionales bacterium]|nr:ParB/RepB/Spo0J family partition protein [Bdellovibrionales bacterium]
MTNLTDPNKVTPANGDPKKALGRGLAALINPALKAQMATTAAAAQKVEQEKSGPRLEILDLKLIDPNPDQPRKVFNEERLQELSESLKEQGLVQPIVVRKKGERFEIIAGERRWRAAGLAQLEKIPAIIRDEKITLVQDDLASLVENLQREQLSPLELASAYERIMTLHNMTQEQLAARVGLSRAGVANTLRLLKLPESVKRLLADGKISEGHARTLLPLTSEAQMGEVAQTIVLRGLSVREAEQIVRSSKSGTPSASPATAPSKAEEAISNKHANLEEELRRIFGTKVAVRGSDRGTIEIYLTGDDSLHRIVHQLRSLAQ